MSVSEAPETHFGFKRITAENWQDADVPRLFQLTTPENWIEAHLEPQLTPIVPQEIAALFEVARGSMIYGWFFYPLITLGAEQCSRVIEAAVRKRCEQAGIPTKRVSKKGKETTISFSENIHNLTAACIIDPSEQTRWEIARKFRNLASHPNSQSIMTPGITVNLLTTSAELINNLF